MLAYAQMAAGLGPIIVANGDVVCSISFNPGAGLGPEVWKDAQVGQNSSATRGQIAHGDRREVGWSSGNVLMDPVGSRPCWGWRPRSATRGQCAHRTWSNGRPEVMASVLRIWLGWASGEVDERENFDSGRR
jgi:hypothetical protein